MANDFVYVLLWWLIFFILGLVVFPFSWLYFRKLADCGWGFTKTLGLLFLSYPALVGATLKLLPLANSSLYVILIVVASLNLLIFIKFKAEILASLKTNWKIIIFSELLFSFGLFFWSLVRGFQPDIRGLEKFMDLGFINSILNSKFLPPADMWFAGKSINYYWFGHFVTAMASRLASLPSFISFNLMLGTILGVLLSGTFSLVSSLTAGFLPKFNRKALAAGLISALVVAFAGNFHAPIYTLKNGVERYWYPDATRFIGYNPETNDKTIHEFPSYSFVVSDLHAHLLDVPFTILFLGLLWSFFLLPEEKSLVQSAKRLILPGFVLGIMIATNTWDFASYLLLAGVALLFYQKRPLEAAAASVFLVITAILTALPFLVHFSSIAEGISFVHSRSPLWQLGILWGFPAVLTLAFLFTVIKLSKGKLQKADFFIAALLAASWTLIIIPEIIFVKDIYIASHYRANTMFKLTYQAFIMFYLTSGYIAIRLITSLRSPVFKKLAGGFLVILFSSILIYPIFAINSYYGGLKNYRGLSGNAWVAHEYPNEYNAIYWLRKNAIGQPTILEAPGDSYTDSNLISSYTGLPTIQGWFVHEWLWRGDSAGPQSRVIDAGEIYNTNDIPVTKKLLEKYNVSYVIVGQAERKKYPNLIESKFGKLGKKVYSSGDLNIYFVRS